MSSSAEGAPLPLDDVRVLDCSGLAGQYAARLLADLGADVIRVEPPGGVEARRRPPFYHDEPAGETSLAFWCFNANKRSVTCNLETADGRALYGRLLESAAVLIEADDDRSLAAAGFSYGSSGARYPGLIWTRISGFGASGPHSQYRATDLVALAMSGVLTLSGYPDRPPVRLPGEQAYICGSIQAAQGIMFALLHRDMSGHGQFIDISLQESLSLAQETAMQTYDLQRQIRQRVGETRRLPAYGTYPCADGYVMTMVGIGHGFGAPWSVLIDWMEEEGQAQDLSEPEWRDFLGGASLRGLAALLTDPPALAAAEPRLRHADEVLQAFLLRHTKSELYEEGQRRRLLIGPVNSVRDLLEDKQLQARCWYTSVMQPAVGAEVLYPGPQYRFSSIPWSIRRPAPRAGEHNAEIYGGELGLSEEQLRILAGAGAI